MQMKDTSPFLPHAGYRGYGTRGEGDGGARADGGPESALQGSCRTVGGPTGSATEIDEAWSNEERRPGSPNRRSQGALCSVKCDTGESADTSSPCVWLIQLSGGIFYEH